ncbi:conserved membrane protein of unknown function [Ruminococcaceae bacterium BL-4]|nr:conserved membrane protein of unknown function [Ruminococcaceae bacterium BL-4]
MNMTEFLSWDFLATFVGAAAVTSLLTQFLKNIGVLSKMPTQGLSYLIALFVLLISTAATGGFLQPWTVWALIPFNAVLVSTSSNGAYQAIVRTRGKS